MQADFIPFFLSEIMIVCGNLIEVSLLNHESMQIPMITERKKRKLWFFMCDKSGNPFAYGEALSLVCSRKYRMASLTGSDLLCTEAEDGWKFATTQ